MLKTANKYGNIYIDKKAIKQIAGSAVSDVYGVWGFSTEHDTVGNWHVKRLLRGMKISSVGSSIVINVDVILKVGVAVTPVSNSIAGAIRFAVEQYTGFSVSDVTVKVVGFRL